MSDQDSRSTWQGDTDDDSLSSWLGPGDEAGGVEAEAALAKLRRGMFRVAEATVSIGRYRDLEEIGRGGMSVVYRGRDEEIGRDVAIKVLRGDDTGQEARLRREARSMARLSHPNVVQVLEVGRHHGETYVVMELVPGRDAAAWLSAEPRPWQQVLEVFLAAGEGLSAAHGQGLVHRDFKPSNVMVGDDGRARVTDFGLAAAVGETPAGGVTVGDDEPFELDDLRTATGALLGTPRYMAPEQWSGARVDHHADQWSFAASLWESLYGRHPFEGEGGRIDPRRAAPVRPSDDRGVPTALGRVLRRALSAEPQARYRSMQELLARLRTAARGRGRRVAQAAVVGSLVLGATWWAAGNSHTAPKCDPLEHSAALWDAERRASVETAFTATELPFARRALADVDGRMSSWVEGWNGAYREACASAAAEAFDARSELRLACLRAELTEVEGLVESLAEADRELVSRAEAATRRLPDHGPCLEPPSREGVDPQVQAAHAERMGRINGRVRAGAYREAATLAEEALAVTTEPALRGEVALSRGLNLRRSGDFDGALAPLQSAFDDAAATGDAKLATRAAIALFQLATARSKNDDAETWARHARTWIARIEDPEDEQRLRREIDLSEAELLYEQGQYDESLARMDEIWEGCDHDESLDFVPRMLNLMGLAHMQRGTYDDAARWFDRSAKLEAERSGPEHPQVASSLENLGSVEWYRGNFDEAESYYRRALAIRQISLGPDNAKTANTVMNLGLIAHVRGDYPGAVAKLEEAVASFTRIVGREHPRTALALGNLAATLAEMGEFERSNESNRESLQIYEATLGPEHPMVGQAMENLASGLSDVGKYEESLRLHERALAVIEGAQGKDHDLYGLTLHNIGVVLRRLDRYEEAEARDREALAVYERSLGPTHPEIAIVLIGLADAALVDGRWEEARALAERARSVEPTVPFARGLAAYYLAEALWETTRDRARVRELVEEAKRELTDAGRKGAENLEALEAWVAEQRL